MCDCTWHKSQNITFLEGGVVSVLSASSVDAGSKEDHSSTEVCPCSVYLASLCTVIVATPQIIEQLILSV